MTVKEWTYEIDFPKTEWYERIRSRMHSHITSLSDSELEEGIAELNATYEGDTIPLRDTFVFILGDKTQ